MNSGLNLESRASMISKQVKKEKVVKELLAGEYFGEICLVLNTPRTCNVRAKSFCELTVLSRHDFDEVVTDFDDERKVLEEIIMEKYKGEAKDWALQKKSLKTLKLKDVIDQQQESESNIGKVLQNIERRLRSMEERIVDNSMKTGKALTRMSRQTMARGSRRTRSSARKSTSRTKRKSTKRNYEDEDDEELSSSADEMDERIAQSLSSIIAQSIAGTEGEKATDVSALKAAIKQARGDIEGEEESDDDESGSSSGSSGSDDEEDEESVRRARKSRLSFDEFKEDPGRQLEMSKTMISGLVEKLNSIIREIRVKSFINDFLIARLKVLKNEVSFLYGNIDKIGDGMPPNSAMFTAHNVSERKEQMEALERVQSKVMELLDEATKMSRYRSNLEDTADRTMIFQKQTPG